MVWPRRRRDGLIRMPPRCLPPVAGISVRHASIRGRRVPSGSVTTSRIADTSSSKSKLIDSPSWNIDAVTSRLPELEMTSSTMRGLDSRTDPRATFSRAPSPAGRLNNGVLDCIHQLIFRLGFVDLKAAQAANAPAIRLTEIVMANCHQEPDSHHSPASVSMASDLTTCGILRGLCGAPHPARGPRPDVGGTLLDDHGFACDNLVGQPISLSACRLREAVQQAFLEQLLVTVSHRRLLDEPPVRSRRLPGSPAPVHQDRRC